jgi:hypothetical protein
MAIITSGVPAATLGSVGFHNTTISGSHPGGLVVPGPTSEVFTLYAGTLSNGGSNVHYPFYKNGSKYQVTSGKRFIVSSIRHYVGSANGGFQLVSATATFSDATASGSLTGGVFQFGAAATYGMTGHQTAKTLMVEAMRYVFAAQTWPGVQFADNTQIYQVFVTGSEET